MEGQATAFEMLVTLASAHAGGAAARRRSASLPAVALPLACFSENNALVRAWQRLESSASLPMQSHAFASALSKTLLAGVHIDVFFIREESGLSALLPLCRGEGAFGRWRMIGAEGVFEPDDALCRTADDARRLAEAIVSDGRALELERVPAGSPLIPALRAAMRGKGWTSVRPWTPTPTIALDARWKDPASCFNSGRRSDFRRAARRAAEHGEVSFEVLAPVPDQFDALFDAAIGVEVRSWKAQSGTAIASCRAKEAFFREFFRSACAQGTLRIAFMRIDGEIVAMQMALESLGRYWLFKIGFDEKYGRCSPGTLLMLHTLGWAAGRELRAYELLGNVEPWIAQFWTDRQHDCVCLRAYPFNLRGAVAFAADAAQWLSKRLVPAKA
jgi:CelD/BcsL family acetyltransferase involved in cellulose biosynthesis